MAFSTRILPGFRAGLTLFLLIGLALTTPAWAQGKKKKLPPLQPGRLHLTDGRLLPAQLRLEDGDVLKALGPDGAEKTYSPDEVSSFVMGTDSFTVLRDFYVTLVRDAEHYSSSFMRVCAAGAGLELYEFRGTMSRQQVSGGNLALVGAGLALHMAAGNTAIPVYGGRQETFVMTTAWLLRRDGNPRWLTLPSGARNLREVLEPLVADDQVLAASVRWGSLRREDVPALLSQYVARKTAKAKS
ncbi:hypothetical protein [Hymenobacter armeniacus]|uniref:Uncharacterized protein n=1 Tax=Hymenobacter armeniacus TaxID=2771358 RepID=A0ABR8JR48_9BACT|nr:hypothetical protein [Hymenobacter armeniacus]MBD2721565.1 hypothetical protein [Hymenobacter armeniacus]